MLAAFKRNPGCHVGVSFLRLPLCLVFLFKENPKRKTETTPFLKHHPFEATMLATCLAARCRGMATRTCPARSRKSAGILGTQVEGSASNQGVVVWSRWFEAVPQLPSNWRLGAVVGSGSATSFQLAAWSGGLKGSPTSFQLATWSGGLKWFRNFLPIGGLERWFEVVPQLPSNWRL